MAPDPQPRAVSHQAADNLAFIRAAMERSSAFTAVPGVGGLVVGAIGIVAAAVAACLVELGAMTFKARRAGVALTGTNARRFACGMAASLAAGAALTYELWTTRDLDAMAPLWLLLYGVGVVAGGMFSVPAVRAMGVCFLATGIAAVLTPAAWSNAWLALGFGGLHVGFGAYIARHHGG